MNHEHLNTILIVIIFMVLLFGGNFRDGGARVIEYINLSEKISKLEEENKKLFENNEFLIKENATLGIEKDDIQKDYDDAVELINSLNRVFSGEDEETNDGENDK